MKILQTSLLIALAIMAVMQLRTLNRVNAAAESDRKATVLLMDTTTLSNHAWTLRKNRNAPEKTGIIWYIVGEHKLSKPIALPQVVVNDLLILDLLKEEQRIGFRYVGEFGASLEKVSRSSPFDFVEPIPMDLQIQVNGVDILPAEPQVQDPDPSSNELKKTTA